MHIHVSRVVLLSQQDEYTAESETGSILPRSPRQKVCPLCSHVTQSLHRHLQRRHDIQPDDSDLEYYLHQAKVKQKQKRHMVQDQNSDDYEVNLYQSMPYKFSTQQPFDVKSTPLSAL